MMWEYLNCLSQLGLLLTKCHRNEQFINNKSLFPTDLEAGNSRVGVVVALSGSGESPLQVQTADV